MLSEWRLSMGTGISIPQKANQGFGDSKKRHLDYDEAGIAYQDI